MRVAALAAAVPVAVDIRSTHARRQTGEDRDREGQGEGQTDGGREMLLCCLIISYYTAAADVAAAGVAFNLSISLDDVLDAADHPCQHGVSTLDSPIGPSSRLM